MAVFVANNLEGTNAAAITNANTAGPNQFTTITKSGTGTTSTFDSTRALAGATSLKHHLAAVASTVYEDWTSTALGTALPNGYSRFYIYMTAYPSVTTRLAAFLGAATLRASLQVTTTGQLRTVNSAGSTIATTTGVMPLNTWVRVEFDTTGISGTTGTVAARFYSGAGLEGTTPNTNGSLSSAAQTVGGTIDNYRLGQSSSVTMTTAWDIWYDSVAFSDTAQPGSQLESGVAPLAAASTLGASGVRGAEGAAVLSASSGMTVSESTPQSLSGSANLSATSAMSTIGRSGAEMVATVLAAPASGTVSPYTTGTITPNSGALVMVVLTTTGGIVAAGTLTASSISSTLNVGAWSLAQQVNNAATPAVGVYVFYAVAQSDAPGTITVSASTSTPADMQVSVVEALGVDTVTPVVGPAGAIGTTASLSADATATPSALDMVMAFGVSRNDTNGAIMGTGFNPLINNWHASPSASQSVEWRTGTNSTTASFSDLEVVKNAMVVLVAKNGSVVQGGPADLSATSTLSAAASVTDVAAAPLAATSALTASGTSSQQGTATLSAASTLTAAGTAATTGQASLVAVGTVNTSATAVRSATAALAATSTLSASATATSRAAAALAASASLTATSSSGASASVTFAASSSLTVSGVATARAAASLSAASTLSTTASLTRLGGASLVATSALTVTAVVATTQSIALVATSTWSAAGTRLTLGTAALTATSVLTATGSIVRTGTVTLLAASTLSASGSSTATATAALQALSSLIVTAQIDALASVDLGAAAALRAEGMTTLLADVALLATSLLLTDGDAIVQAALDLSADSDLTVTADVVPRVVALALTAAATMLAGGKVRGVGYRDVSITVGVPTLNPLAAAAATLGLVVAGAAALRGFTIQEAAINPMTTTEASANPLTVNAGTV